MSVFDSLLNNGPVNSFFDPMAPQTMKEASSLAQLALQQPDLAASLFASQGIAPPAPKEGANIGRLAADKSAIGGGGIGAAGSAGAADDATTRGAALAKALSALQPAPAQPVLQPPAAVTPRAATPIDTGSIARMMQLLSSPGAGAGRVPSLGALIAGR